jgi:4-alpha-glucanotransferase
MQVTEPNRGWLAERPPAAGVLLHPTSLPGGPIGTIGEGAHDFVDRLAEMNVSVWQILPLVPVAGGGSPYAGLSAMAGNTLLLDPATLVSEALVHPDGSGAHTERVDFEAARERTDALLEEAHERFRAGAAPHLREPLDAYREREAAWLDDWTLFRVLRTEREGAPWTDWEAPLRDRDPEALDDARRAHADRIDREVLAQYLFDRQWGALRSHAHRQGVEIFGDLPIFLAHDSADVWANPDLFRLDDEGRPEVVTGVPPDYFSETGQRWGNPHYRWDEMARRDYAWWAERFRRTFELVDIVRVDHFRGFEAAWEIDRDEETAVNGRWVKGPAAEIFRSVERRIGSLPIVAEDLGLITDEVDELREELGFPGMRVLQFAFGGDEENPHLPENHERNSVAYTGTHDNDTSLGWYRSAGAAERAHLHRVLGGKPEEPHWSLIEMALDSPGRLAVVPVQDFLGLGSEGRMNTPGSDSENWSWRLQEPLDPECSRRFAEAVRRAGRAGGGKDPSNGRSTS